MPHFLLPPILTALCSLGAAAFIIFKIPPETAKAKLIFVFALGLFIFGSLSVLIFLIKKKKLFDEEDQRLVFKKSLRTATIFTILLTSCLLVKLFLF